jgi:hypothetical protein
VTPEAPRRRLAGPLGLVSIGVLVVAGAGLALVLSRGGGGGPEPGPGEGVLPTAPLSAPLHTARTTTAPKAAATTGWPVGATGFTVVVATLAKHGHTRAAATRLAAQVTVPGARARVLDSSEHPRLRPDVWIVYIGRYSTRAPAERLARRLRSAGSRRGIVERLTG